MRPASSLVAPGDLAIDDDLDPGDTHGGVQGECPLCGAIGRRRLTRAGSLDLEFDQRTVRHEAASCRDSREVAVEVLCIAGVDVGPRRAGRHCPVEVQHHVAARRRRNRPSQVQELVPDLGSPELVGPEAGDLEGLYVAEDTVRDESYGKAACRRIAEGVGARRVHVRRDSSLAAGEFRDLVVGPVVLAVRLIARTPNPGPEHLVGPDQPQVSQEMRANLLTETNHRGRTAIGPPKPVLLSQALVEIGHKRCGHIETLSSHDRTQVFRVESVGPAVVEVEVLVTREPSGSRGVPHRPKLDLQGCSLSRRNHGSALLGGRSEPSGDRHCHLARRCVQLHDAVGVEEDPPRLAVEPGHMTPGKHGMTVRVHHGDAGGDGAGLEGRLCRQPQPTPASGGVERRDVDHFDGTSVDGDFVETEDLVVAGFTEPDPLAVGAPGRGEGQAVASAREKHRGARTIERSEAKLPPVPVGLGNLKGDPTPVGRESRLGLREEHPFDDRSFFSGGEVPKKHPVAAALLEVQQLATVRCELRSARNPALACDLRACRAVRIEPPNADRPRFA